MEMLVPIPLALSMGQLLQLPKRVFVGFCSVLMASTIFLSGSRGGMVAFIFEMVFFCILTFGRRRRIPIVIGYAAFCISTLGVIFLSSNGRGLARIGDLDPGIRPEIMKDSLRMFVKHPILGWGLATFPTVYPQYRSFYTDLFVNEAHNDYAQLLVETGVIGFTLMLWFLMALFRHGLESLHHWQYHWDRMLSLAALVGCTGILIHSFADFNLQIPANAAFFYVMCALAATDLQLSRLKQLS
jgi:O-antigen ligase